MKQILILAILLIIVAACAQMQQGETRNATPTIALATETITVPSTAKQSTPTPFAIPTESRVRETLERFMRARVKGEDETVMNLLTPELRANMDTVLAQVPLLQVSNPCWYRFEILQFEEPTPLQANAQIRMYEHFWAGDSAGGPPSSWTQTVDLQETNSEWRVSALGKLENQQSEPNEPHGQTLSACNAVRTP